MCGIAGFCNGADDSVEKIRKMTDAIIHRGPDSEGYWMTDDRTVVLGHRRLSILDCSNRGSQPMKSQSGRFVISYNGEIYNHIEMRDLLIKRGIVFRGTSDTETLVEMFESYGVDKTLGMIKGMFAIALYDLEERILYLIRDRVGEKPLYYGMVNGRLIFASDLRCFKVIDDGSIEIDPGALELYFRRGYIPAPYSIYRNIYKVEPGRYVKSIYPFTEYHSITYWNSYVISEKCHNNRFHGSVEEADNELERILKTALKGQMLSDVPLGAFLSAGIDSSVIVSLMQEISSKPVRTFTIGVDASGYDEAPTAKRVAEILGTKHTEKYISISDIKSVIPHIGEMYSEPFADSSQIPTSVISQIARENVTVVLSGDGGDELFCGYGRYNGWIFEEWEKQRRFPLSVQRMRSVLLSLAGRGRSPKARKLFSDSIASTYATANGLDTSFVRSEQLYSDFFDDFDKITDFTFDTDQDTLMQMDFGEYLPDDILAKVDRAAMYHSLETRLPFLDRDVIEFVWTLPFDMKYNDGITKHILRRILYKRVPRELIERPKTGFSIPLYEWMRDGDLWMMCDELFDKARLDRVSDYLNTKKCRDMWDMFAAKGIWSESLWYLIVFLQWFNIHC